MDAEDVTEKKTRVETFLHEAICNDCKEGTLVSTGHAYTTFRTYYQHRCGKCGAMATLRESYPYTTHEKVQ